jgi:hypothetical protein
LFYSGLKTLDATTEITITNNDLKPTAFIELLNKIDESNAADITALYCINATITCKQLNQLFTRYPQLTHVVITSCTLSQPTPIDWPETATDIDLSHSNITDEQLDHLFQCCPQLQSLSLAYCKKLHFINITWGASLKILNLCETEINYAYSTNPKDVRIKLLKEQLSETMIGMYEEY